jgi:hypothetical protein
MVTLNKLTEQARRIYARDFGKREDVKPLVEDRELKLLIVQAANELLAIEPKQGTKLGDITIPTCMIATYTAQSVVGSGPYHTVLPAFPIHLPQDMGVWSVASSTGVEYIPITSAAWSLLSSLDEGLLENQVGFRVEGRKILYTSVPSGPVTVKLLIIDTSLLGDNDPFPISVEYEAAVISRALQLLTGVKVAEEEKPKR